jgi:aspartyl-tRNA(Asn)/glutamyl-tRNA(Gln) amidotransferase subunit A
MVPLAIGTQTAGSVIRPASYCGVVGFKPTFGTIPRTGVLIQSPSLDTLGVFARTVEDAAMFAGSLSGYDAGDPVSRPEPPPRLFDVSRQSPPVTPSLAFVRQPAWETDATDDTKDAFAELIDALGDACDEIDLPEAFAHALHLREIVNLAEAAKCYHGYMSRGRDRLSEGLRAELDEGARILAYDYLAARDWPNVLNDGLDAVFSRFDAIVTPAAPGAAPNGLEKTGSPNFNSIWTFCGTPAVTLPLLGTESGLPIGVQLVGRRGDDARLLRTARWLTQAVSE